MAFHLLILGAFIALLPFGFVIVFGLALSAPKQALIGVPPHAMRQARNVAMPSKSGSLLKGWWLPATAAQGGTVILLHGVGANRLKLVRRAEVLAAHGFSVLLFDLQAHGESRGRRITYGKLEALDAAAALDFARVQRPFDKVGMIGISLGGAAAIVGAVPLKVDALVLEAVFPTIEDALRNRCNHVLGRRLGRLFTPCLVWIFTLSLPPFIGARPSELRPADHLEATPPLLVMCGTADKYTLLGEAAAMFERAPPPKRFWAVERAGHVDLEAWAPSDDWREVLSFLTAFLRPEQSAP